MAMKGATGRPFAVFDIDGTLIRWQLYHAVADALARLGYFDQEVFKNVRKARMQWKRRVHSESFKDYEQRLVSAYEALLGQLTVGQFQEAAKSVFEEYKDQAYTYTRSLISELKKQDYLLFAISNSQIEIVEKVASHYGFDDCIGAVYEQKDGRFTGNVTMHLKDKDVVLQQLAAKHRAMWQGSVAVGDSANDISMLKLVDQPIAFNPESTLFAEAKKHNWQIVVERKNIIYKLKPIGGSYTLVN